MTIGSIEDENGQAWTRLVAHLPHSTKDELTKLARTYQEPVRRDRENQQNSHSGALEAPA